MWLGRPRPPILPFAICHLPLRRGGLLKHKAQAAVTGLWCPVSSQKNPSVNKHQYRRLLCGLHHVFELTILRIRLFELGSHCWQWFAKAEQEAALDGVIHDLRQRPAARQGCRHIELGSHYADHVAALVHQCAVQIPMRALANTPDGRSAFQFDPQSGPGAKFLMCWRRWEHRRAKWCSGRSGMALQCSRRGLRG